MSARRDPVAWMGASLLLALPADAAVVVRDRLSDQVLGTRALLPRRLLVSARRDGRALALAGRYERADPSPFVAGGALPCANLRPPGLLALVCARLTPQALRVL